MKILGSSIGDVAASPYSPLFINKPSKKNYTMFSENSRTTCDAGMTLAIAKALLTCKPDYSDLSETAEECMRKMCVGPILSEMILSPMILAPLQYGDIISAVSPVAYAAKSLKECQELALAVTPCDSEYSMYGAWAAQAAGCVYLALHGAKKWECLNRPHYSLFLKSSP